MKVATDRCNRRYGKLTRAVLSAVVATAGIVTLAASAQGPAVNYSQGSIEPSHSIPSLDALPQITAAELAAPQVAKPFRTLDDPVTFAAKKAEAKSLRFKPEGLTPMGAPFGAPAQMQPGLSGPEAELAALTVNPPDSVFLGTSNAECGAVTGFSVTPADQAIAVGNTPVGGGLIQGINICVSVFDKGTGVRLAGYPKSAKTFFGTTLNTSDPRMLYDWIRNRYMYVVIEYPNSCASSCTAAAYYRLAVSSGNDPTGGWCHYQVPVVTSPNPSAGVYALPDFPRLGQDREAVYLASNLFQPGYVGEEIIALRKDELYACGPVPFRAITGLSKPPANNGFTIQPASVFGPGDQPKSMYFVTSFIATTNQLVISAWHNPFSDNTFTQVTINAASAYSTPPDATQQGTATLIATNDQRISATPWYASGSIYAALTTNGGNGQPGINLYQIQPFVDTSGGANDGKITGARILNEIRVFGGAGSSLAWYYPAQQPDAEGNVTTVFGFSSSAHYASLAYVSRRAGQAVNTLPDAGVFAITGLGPYTGGRWGDYWATAPAGIVSGGGTGSIPKMWFAGMYATAGNNWGTVIGKTGYTSTSQD